MIESRASPAPRASAASHRVYERRLQGAIRSGTAAMRPKVFCQRQPEIHFLVRSISHFVKVCVRRLPVCAAPPSWGCHPQTFTQPGIAIETVTCSCPGRPMVRLVWQGAFLQSHLKVMHVHRTILSDNNQPDPVALRRPVILGGFAFVLRWERGVTNSRPFHVPTSQAHSILKSKSRISFSSRFEFLSFHTAWVIRDRCGPMLGPTMSATPRSRPAPAAHLK